MNVLKSISKILFNDVKTNHVIATGAIVAGCFLLSYKMGATIQDQSYSQGYRDGKIIAQLELLQQWLDC